MEFSYTTKPFSRNARKAEAKEVFLASFKYTRIISAVAG
jgi:hypothetical protein